MELLILTEQRGNRREGDVICVREDNFDWGAEEKQKELFRIIRCPDSELWGSAENAQDEFCEQIEGIFDENDETTWENNAKRYFVIGSELKERTLTTSDPFAFSESVNKTLTVTVLY